MTLPALVEYHSDSENALSLASRLAVANGFRSLKVFLTAMGIHVTDLVKGHENAVATLAKWSGVAPDALTKFAITPMGDRNRWRLGDAIFCKEMRKGDRFRYCPCCTVDDIDNGSGPLETRPHVRSSWMTKAVENCVKHQRPMLEVELPDFHKNDFCRFVSETMGTVREQAERQARVQHMDVDIYAEKRIRGIPSQSFLDKLEAHVAINLCLYLGRFVNKMDVVSELLPSELQMASDREIGFHFAKGDGANIEKMISHVIRQRLPRGAEKFIFGQLGSWLRANNTRAAFSEIVDHFQEIVVRRLPFGPGEMCFVPVRQRYVHSVGSASAEYGLVGKRIIQLLNDARLLNETDGLSHTQIYFEAQRAHKILSDACETLTSEEVRTKLGVSSQVMSHILEANLIPRVETRSDTRLYSRIRTHEMERFQRQIFSAVSFGEVGPDMQTAASVANKTAYSYVDILKFQIEGDLRNTRALPDHGFKLSALRFDHTEITEIISARRAAAASLKAGIPVMNQRGASSYLRVKTTTIPFLIQKGFLESVSVRNEVNQQQHPAVTVESLDAFKAKYVSVADVAKLHGTHPIMMVDVLKKNGIEPVIKGGPRITRFFQKSDLVGLEIVTPPPKK